jgi:hypothetical protein
MVGLVGCVGIVSGNIIGKKRQPGPREGSRLWLVVVVMGGGWCLMLSHADRDVSPILLGDSPRWAVAARCWPRRLHRPTDGGLYDWSTLLYLLNLWRALYLSNNWWRWRTDYGLPLLWLLNKYRLRLLPLRRWRTCVWS